jgi:hypothetical protein
MPSDPDLTVEAVLSDDLRAWLMREPRYPVLAINSADGPPNQSVMWFDLDPDAPDTILMNTMVRRLKYRQLHGSPQAGAPAHPGPRAPVRWGPGALRRSGAGHRAHEGRQGHSS